MQAFIQTLAKLINESKKTQVLISKEMGISKQKLTNWKSGYNEPSLEELVLISTYFGVSCDYLLGIEKEDGTKII